uniref:Uncharacterized protein n=1 Tax=Steinernema glaseri TaxID=37863 RepID=A0A1I7YL98_9BILA
MYIIHKQQETKRFAHPLMWAKLGVPRTHIMFACKASMKTEPLYVDELFGHSSAALGVPSSGIVLYHRCQHVPASLLDRHLGEHLFLLCGSIRRAVQFLATEKEYDGIILYRILQHLCVANVLSLISTFMSGVFEISRTRVHAVVDICSGSLSVWFRVGHTLLNLLLSANQLSIAFRFIIPYEYDAHKFRCGLVVRICGSHPQGPGSIPGIGRTFYAQNF